MKKLIKFVLITLVCLILLIGVAGYIVLKHVDLNKYKGVIETKVAEATGRKLTIGNIEIKASFTPTVELENVKFANASWAKDKDMAMVEAIDVGVALLPLLHSQYVVNKFVIKNAVINLEESANNGANWVFETAAPVQDKTSFNFSLISCAYAEENATSEDDISNLLSNIIIKELAFDNVKINYTDKTAQTQSYDIKRFSLDENGDENIDFDFDVNNGLYQGTGTLGALKLLKAENGYPVTAEVNVMGIMAKVDAFLFDILGNISFDGKAVVRGFLGKDSSYNELADVNVKGNLKKIDVNLNSVSIADNVITGGVSIDLEKKVPFINATLASDRIDIASFEKKQKVSWNVEFIPQAKATTLVASDKIPYDALYAVNAAADINIVKLMSKNAVIMRNVVLDAKLDNGVATLKILQGMLADGNVKANAELNAGSKSLNLTADLVKVNVRDLMKALDVKVNNFSIIDGSNTDVYVKLSGKGNTYASVVDGLNGQVSVIMDKSKLHIGNLSVIADNIFSQLLNTLKITKGNDDLELKCAVVRTDIKDGKAVFPSGIVFNADKFTVVANGDINLKNDKIDFGVKPFGGKLTDTNIATALSSLVKLTGTIKDPSIAVDTANAVKNIVGATMTGPVYLGAQMVMESDSSPCYTALKGTGYEKRFPVSNNVAKATTDSVGKVLDDSVDIVKDTAKGLFNMLSGKSQKKAK